MILTATDFYTYLRPSKCDLRIYLKHWGEEEAPPGPYEEVLRRLGIRHEQSHLKTFPEYIDLSPGTIDQRERRTNEAVAQGAPVLYQPVLRAKAVLDGVECEIIGEPDFLVNDQGKYIVRDSKISRRITEDAHPEIMRQLELYGWLYEQAFGQPPSALQVHGGTGEIVPLPYQDGAVILEALKEILALKVAEAEPYHPVGWTKCGNCSFRPRCWSRAVESRDIALVAGVDQGLAKALWHIGIRTVDQFLARFNETSLAEFQRPWGKRTQRVGRAAWKIMTMVRPMASGKESILQRPEIPEHPNYVMFDLEGLPPHLVYFYCHGGLTRGKPYLQVGTSGQINSSNLRARKIQWEAPRPLVFINGCHTTALEPLQALEFISPLVTYSHCAGVIGTEITIFEELATAFAEECLRRFLKPEPIGVALRGARLRLLQKEGNPLGLVYIPFVIASLALKDQRAPASGDVQPPSDISNPV